MTGFETFGADHWGALAATALAAAWAIRAGGPRFARLLGWVLVVVMALDPFLNHALGYLSLRTSLPLELCDLASVACIVALWTRRQTAFECAWFWGLSGTLQALITPDLKFGFPHPEYLRFILFHGGIVVGVLHLGPGTGMRPRRGAAMRVFGWTLLYAAAIVLLDWLIEANYFFLREKPPGTVLDLFGPWPWYIGGATAIAALLFWLLDLPYRRRRTKSEPSTSG